MSGAALERPLFAWRNLAFTSRYWIPLRQCWILRSARQGKQEVADKVVLQRGDATQLANLFHTRSFDVILCHNILEYCEDPAAVLHGAARVLRDSSAILSILVRNQAGEVFKAAIQAGDLAAAEDNLTAEWGEESLYGGRVRLFTPAQFASHDGGRCLWRPLPSEVYVSLQIIAATDFSQRRV